MASCPKGSWTCPDRRASPSPAPRALVRHESLVPYGTRCAHVTTVTEAGRADPLSARPERSSPSSPRGSPRVSRRPSTRGTTPFTGHWGLCTTERPGSLSATGALPPSRPGSPAAPERSRSGSDHGFTCGACAVQPHPPDHSPARARQQHRPRAKLRSRFRRGLPPKSRTPHSGSQCPGQSATQMQWGSTSVSASEWAWVSTWVSATPCRC